MKTLAFLILVIGTAPALAQVIPVKNKVPRAASATVRPNETTPPLTGRTTGNVPAARAARGQQINALKFQRATASAILLTVHPVAFRRNQTEELAEDVSLMLDTGFSVEELSGALKNAYHLSLSATTLVVFVALLKSANMFPVVPHVNPSLPGFRIDRTQAVISQVYQTDNKSTVKLLKQADDSLQLHFFTADRMFYMHYDEFYQNGDERKSPTLIKDMIEAGYDGYSIYGNIILRMRNQVDNFIDNYCSGMKQAHVPAAQVAHALLQHHTTERGITQGIERSQILMHLRWAGYSASEILEAMNGLN